MKNNKQIEVVSSYFLTIFFFTFILLLSLFPFPFYFSFPDIPTTPLYR